MSRRKLTLGAYVRRRWRSVGAVIVLLLGALLVLTVTDRGHDPVWRADAVELDKVAVSPDGAMVYSLLRAGENVTALQAIRGSDGAHLWRSELAATRALLAASEDGAAVATDFPSAFLTRFGPTGDLLWQTPLEGNPIGLRMQGDRLAIALNAPGNPVLVFEGSSRVHALRTPEPIRSLDMEGDLVATGGLSGALLIHRGEATIINATFPFVVQSLRIAADGTAVFAGGSGLRAEDARGMVAFLDVDAPQPIRWTQETRVGVSLVDLDAAGLFALAVEEDPPGASVHVFEGATGATRWTRVLDGSVARDDAGAQGGVAVSPDASLVAVGSLRGDLQMFDARSGALRWAFDAGGVTASVFPDEQPRRLLVGARLIESTPPRSLLLFHADAEPPASRAPLLAGTFVSAAAAALIVVVGVGFWRARRPY